MDKLTDKWDEVLRVFRKKKVMTLEELAEFSSCSQRTVQRRLMQWKTYTSYNQNGRYYVLASIPKFEKNGLWKHKGILFSKRGKNLRDGLCILHQMKRYSSNKKKADGGGQTRKANNAAQKHVSTGMIQLKNCKIVEKTINKL